MWPFSSRKQNPDILITRDELRLLIYHQCDHHTVKALNKKYKLVPTDKGWVRRRTPSFVEWVEDFDDCNHRALRAMAKMQTHCFGMVVVETDDQKIYHVLNLIVMEDMVVRFYDPTNLEFSGPSDWGKVVSTWI